MRELAEWDSFYVIIASSAGALIGLQFVVITLIAEKPVRGAEGAGQAFASPTIVHFSSALLLSALMRVPWPSMGWLASCWSIIGLGGLAYAAVVARRMKEQHAYEPVLEDWVFHIALPALAYAMLMIARILVDTQPLGGLFVVAAAALVLLFIGIHNAWDAIYYHVFFSVPVADPGSKSERGGEP